MQNASSQQQCSLRSTLVPKLLSHCSFGQLRTSSVRSHHGNSSLLPASLCFRTWHRVAPPITAHTPVSTMLSECLCESEQLVSHPLTAASPYPPLARQPAQAAGSWRAVCHLRMPRLLLSSTSMPPKASPETACECLHCPLLGTPDTAGLLAPPMLHRSTYGCHQPLTAPGVSVKS